MPETRFDRELFERYTRRAKRGAKYSLSLSLSLATGLVFLSASFVLAARLDIPKGTQSLALASANAALASASRALGSFQTLFAPELAYDRHAMQAATAVLAPASGEPQATSAIVTQSQPGTPQQNNNTGTGTTTIINNYITQPVVERSVAAVAPSVAGYVTQAELAAQVAGVTDAFRRELYGSGYPSPATSYQTGGVWNAIALSNRIENLSGVTISNPTISGGSVAATSFTGTLGIGSGGTGVTDAPSYGQLLVGNASGGYTLTATSSLGITGGSGASLSDANTWTALQLFSAGASTTQMSVFGPLYVGTTATTTISGTATSTFGAGIQASALDITGAATSTAANGFNLAAGCFAVNGTCVTGGSGASLSDANTWTALQLFSAAASSTQLSVFSNAYFGGTATSTFDSAGNLSVAGTLGITGATTLGNFTATNGTTTNATSTNLAVTGTASTSALVASNSFTFSNVTGFLKAVAGAVSTALVNLASDVTGILPVANGGTGWANIAAGAIPYGNGTDALATTTAGTAGYVLAYLNGAPTWTATSTLADITGTLAAGKGGTGISSVSAGGVLLGDYSGTGWQQLATSSLGLLTTNVAEGGNLYYTDARVGSYISGSSTVPHIGGSAFGDLFSWTGSAWTTRATSTLALNTDNLTEGSSNLFWTDTRFDNRLSATTTLPNLTTLANLATLGTVTSGTWSGSFGAVSGANLTGLTAANITAGTAGINISGNAGTVTNGVYTTTFDGLFDNRLSASSSVSGITTLPNLSLPSGQVAGLGSLATLSTINNDNWSGTALAVGNGGTGQTSFGQGWLSSNGTTLSASTSPTVNYIVATSTTATSTFAAGLQSTYLNITGTAATSTFANGIDLSGGCFSILGTCVGGASSQWTTSGSDIYYTTGSVFIGTTTPGRTLTVFNTSANPQQRISYDATRYAELYADASGALNLTATGKILNFLDGNLYLCDGGACPTTPVQGYPTFTSQGNLVAGGTVYAAGFAPVTCPSGMIPVPASPADGTNGFCVDKYEAQSSSGNEVSVQGGSPWVSITQTSARAECIRAGKHLITEKEWMTIAHNAENVGWNWNGGAAGTNQMSDGHSDSSPASALATAADTSPCSGTGQTCDTSTWDAQRRTYKLSNGEYIWDLGGNVWEWVDQTVTNDYPIVNSAAAGWQACSTSGDGICGNTRTTNDQWYRGGFSTIAGFIRGGGWDDGAVDGAFTLTLGNAPSISNTGIGFRCSR